MHNMIANPQRIGGNGQARIESGGSRHEAAIDNVQIIDAAKLAKFIERRRVGIFSHADGADSVRKSFDLMNITKHRAGLAQNLPRFFD